MTKLQIPPQLIDADFRFIKLRKYGKVPIEKQWTTENNYDGYDLEIQKHIQSGNNYGVIGDEHHVIVDTDTEELRQLLEQKLPETFTVESPGSHGWHCYFLCNMTRPIRLRSIDKVNVGDIQGIGKQVVGASCIHPNGGEYKIVKDVQVARITENQLQEVFAEYIIKELEVTEEESNPIKKIRKDFGVELDISEVIDLSGLKRRGDEYQGAHPIHGSDTGQNFCVNIGKGTWYCFRCETGGGALSWLAVREGLIECYQAKPGALRGDILKKVMEIAKKEFPEKFETKIIKKDNGVGYDLIEDLKEKVPIIIINEGKQQAIYYTAKKLVEKNEFATMRDTEEILHYNDGIYHQEGEQKIKEIVENTWMNIAKTHDVTEIVNHVRRMSYVNRKTFSEDLFLICVKNGILNVKTGKLEDFSSDKKFTWRIPVIYDYNADCPKIKKFLNEIIYSEDIPTIFELIGYCIYPDYCYQKAFMMAGSGGNGKSKLLGLIKTFLGSENVTSLGINELEKNNYAKGILYGKLANIYPDLPDDSLKTTGTFKMLTGGDMISSDQKYLGRIDFINHAKLIYSANKLPEAYDDTDAFFRRWIIISFPNVFDETNRNPKILEEITTEEELSGLLNEAIKGLHRLMDRGDFTTTKSTEEWREDYIRLSDPIKAFVMDCIDISPEAYIPKPTLYSAFVEYCKKSKLPVKTSNMFTRDLKSHVHVDESKRKVGDTRKECVIGIEFKENVKDIIPDITKIPGVEHKILINW